MLARRKPIEFELERTIRAPIDHVFARLVDIEGHNYWLADTGSILKHTRQTSSGEPGVGTTFVGETTQGTLPGQIVEMEAPHTVVHRWWERNRRRARANSKAGRATIWNPLVTTRACLQRLSTGVGECGDRES